MKKILLTGATGFIGQHAIQFLLARNYEVHAVSSKSAIQSKNVSWHTANLLDASQTKTLIEKIKPTHLLHFAWYAVPGKYWTATENLDWIAASVNLLKHFSANSGQRAVMAGTCAEYDWHYQYCCEEFTPLIPQSLYGASKHALQSILNYFSAQNKISSAWGRIFYLYGPFEQSNRLVPSVINSLLKGESVKCTEGSQIRDFLHVEDVASAFVALLDSEITGAVNIASGQPIAIKDVVTKLSEKLNKENSIMLGAIPRPANDPQVLIADVSRLTKEIGWQPRYNLDSGLMHTIDWWKNRLPSKL